MESSKEHKISYIINIQTTKIQCCLNEYCPFRTNQLQCDDSVSRENILWNHGLLKLFSALKMMDESTSKEDMYYHSIFDHNYFSHAVKDYIDQHWWFLFPNKPKQGHIKNVQDTLSHHPNFVSGKRKFKKAGYWQIQKVSKMHNQHYTVKSKLKHIKHSTTKLRNINKITRITRSYTIKHDIAKILLLFSTEIRVN